VLATTVRSPQEERLYAAVTREHGLGPRGRTAQARARQRLREGAALGQLPRGHHSGPSREPEPHLRLPCDLWLAVPMRCAGALPAAARQAAGQCASPHVPPPQPPQCRAAAHARRRRHVVRADGAAAVGHTSASDVSSSDHGNGSDSPGSRASHAWSASTLAIHGGAWSSLRGSIRHTVGCAAGLGCRTETTRVPDSSPVCARPPPLAPRRARWAAEHVRLFDDAHCADQHVHVPGHGRADRLPGTWRHVQRTTTATTDTLPSTCLSRKGRTRALSTGATGTPPHGQRRTS
jgi:hypothetical protein